MYSLGFLKFLCHFNILFTCLLLFFVLDFFHIVLHCISLYCIVLHCLFLSCVVLYSGTLIFFNMKYGKLDTNKSINWLKRIEWLMTNLYPLVVIKLRLDEMPVIDVTVAPPSECKCRTYLSIYSVWVFSVIRILFSSFSRVSLSKHTQKTLS